MADDEEKEENSEDWDIIYNEFERVSAMKQEQREHNEDPFATKIEDFNLVKMRHCSLQKALESNKVGGRLILMALSKTKRKDKYDIKADDIINVSNLLQQRCIQYNEKETETIQPIIHLTITRSHIDPLALQQLSNLLLNHVSYKFLIRLNLSNIGLCYNTGHGLNSIIYLSQGLKANKTLESIRLDQNNRIPSKGLRVLLFDGILYHPTLESLSYKSNNLNIAHMEVFKQFLKHNSLLQRLYLDRNGIDSLMLNELSQGLMQNSNIKTLSFRSNAIEDDGVLQLCRVLKENEECNINMIDLFGNQLLAKSGEYFGDALSKNYSLTKLYLSYNNIGDEGVIALCNGFKFNTSLWRLRLTNCGLTNRCCSVLGSVLETHCNISELELEVNGVVELSKGIGKSKYLKYLNLTRTYPGLEGAKALAEAIKKQVINVAKLENDIKKWILSSPMGVVIPMDIVGLIVEQFAGFRKFHTLTYSGNVTQYLDAETQPLSDMYTFIFDRFGYEIKIMW